MQDLPPRTRNRLVRMLLLSFALGLGTAGIVTGAASAYDGAAAARWADNNDLNRNCEITPCFHDDCTGFVSAAMHFGGSYPYYGLGQNNHDDHYWWLQWNPYLDWTFTDSWADTKDLYQFEMWHIPGGADYGVVQPGWTHLSSGRSVGDLFFYDWAGNGDITHASMMVATGTDPNNTSWVGDLIDQHTTDRYHAYWTLAPYNPQVLTTKIHRVKIYATN